MTSISTPLIAVAGTIGDPDGTRTVLSIVGLLVALGLGLVMLAVWLHKSTRPDPELLAPLEVMGERRWRRADPVWQRRRLDEVRPAGAHPLEPAAAPPDVDESFDRGPAVTGFADLRESGDQPATGAAGADSPADDIAAAPAEDPAGADAASSNGTKVTDRRSGTTPTGIERPNLDEFPDHEIDPDVLAAAMAAIDAELQGEGERSD